MNSACLVCKNPAKFADSIKTSLLYCSKLCQITGNLTDLTSDGRWNKDVFLLLMKQLPFTDRYKLLDSLLKDASDELQRKRMLKWMHEPSLGLDNVAAVASTIGLNSLLLYYDSYNKTDYEFFEWILVYRDHITIPMPFDTLKIVLGKLNQAGRTVDMKQVISRFAFLENAMFIEYLFEQYQLVDWLHEYIFHVRHSIETLQRVGVSKNFIDNDLNLRGAHREKLRLILSQRNDIFKNRAKRAK